MSLRALFFGTPQFAVPTLKTLIECPDIEVTGVLTQPDRPAGRGKHFHPPPVKQIALEYKLDILQPEKLKEPHVMPWLESHNPDVIVVVAYGGFVMKKVREFPMHGCINLHPSLLPKYRGAAPIHWAILNGDKESGNTTMYLSAGWDSGDMIYQEKMPIHDHDTYGTLAERLSQHGADLMIRTLLDVDHGRAPRIPQNHEEAVMAPMIQKEEAYIQWDRSAREIFNQVRGMNPIPGAYTIYQGERWKIFWVDIIEQPPQHPGTILTTAFNTIRVSARDAVVEIKELQPPGKKPMSVAEFLRGHEVKTGISFD